MTTCRLCGGQGPIRQSHIIPKFIENWTKDTSATGFLRSPANPNLRTQSFSKIRLLCDACEQRFSVAEKAFSERIFGPYQEHRKGTFRYGSWLEKFAVSLAWRTTVAEIEPLRDQNPKLASTADSALGAWSKFLLDEEERPGPHNFYLLFFDGLMPDRRLRRPEGFHSYVLRASDSTLGSDGSDLVAYTKLPGILFCAAIEPRRRAGWPRSRICSSGTIRTGQPLNDSDVWSLLLNRVGLFGSTMQGMSPTQLEKIEASVDAEPERAIRSRTYEAFLANRELRRTEG